MKKTLLILLAFSVLAGCGAKRMGGYAPRRPDIPEHKGVKVNALCLDCHDTSKLRGHGASDNCLGCHNMIPER